MASKVDIYNLALQRIGAKRITSIDDDSKGAKAITAIWDEVLRRELAFYPWNFALKQAELAQLSTDPVFGFDKAYQLPADCLTVRKMSNDDYEYRVAGRTLETDLDSSYGDGYEVQIEYIALEEDTTVWSSLFVDLMSLALAKDIAVAMVGKKSTADELRGEYELARERAMYVDVHQDNVTDDNLFESTSKYSFLNVR